MRCPRCSSSVLAAKTIDGVPVQLCPSCDGSLVEQKNLIRLLDALGRQLANHIDVDTVIEAVEDHVDHAACPKCGKNTATFGYMGTNLVFVDRCSDCWLLWMDADELGVMTLLHLRTNRRGRKVFDTNKQRHAEHSRRVGRQLVARAQSNAVANSMLTSGSNAHIGRHRFRGSFGWVGEWLRDFSD
ncbi:MAG: Zn-finger nucleic acid-binding protein [Kiritimatiellia bacterium]|jgi:Zn-finger nucleic acid-binding protein